jgi:CRP-like cAMP-binding protein
MDFAILSRSPLFKGISPDEITGIMSGIPMRIRKFPAGTMVYSTGDTVSALALVISGYVKGEMIDFTGRVIKIEDIQAPGVIAPAFMFGNRNRFPVNVVAVPDTELLIIDKNDFLNLLKYDTRILINFLDLISNRSQFLSEKIKFLNFKTIRSKLAHYILDLAPDGKNIVKLDRTQNDLADYFGVARPSIARSLSEMEDLGFISTNGKMITILNRRDLTALTVD